MADRFASFDSVEVTMIYAGLLEATKHTPGWEETDSYQRLKRECGEAVDSKVRAHVEAEFAEAT